MTAADRATIPGSEARAASAIDHRRAPSRGAGRVHQHWRPSLGLIVAGTVALLFVLPIVGMGAVVIMTREPGELWTSLAQNSVEIAFALLVVAAAATLVGYAFWRGLTRPIARLVDQAEAVAGGAREFDVSGPFGTQELASLADSFAATVDGLQRRSRTLETFSTHLAHELKSPLTGIRGAAELLREEGHGMEEPQRARFLGNIADDADRLTALVSRLRELARTDAEIARGRASLGAVLPALRAAHPGLVIEASDPDHDLPIASEGLGIVLHHIADNAVRHGGTKLVLIGTPSGLTIENDGDPIPSGDALRLLTAFFTTRREEGGTGLGLAIAASIVSEAGGVLSLGSTDPVRFEISF